MARTVVIDELVITVRVPADLPDRAARAVRRALTAGGFRAGVERAVRAVVRAAPALAAARVTVTR